MATKVTTIPASGDQISPDAIPPEEIGGECKFVLHDDMRITFFCDGEAVLTIPESVTARLGRMLQGMRFDTFYLS
ncbi:hypothetical protein [Dentiradicibacter hellwigii]|uniref:Uncharacterized protein n=1 Tax=Dentiradicibacter hellwigii TaxID=3149053 RepID=A0ABV4UBV2_9RHOO